MLTEFVAWNRSTALAPAINKKNKELEEREELLKDAKVMSIFVIPACPPEAGLSGIFLESRKRSRMPSGQAGVTDNGASE